MTTYAEAESGAQRALPDPTKLAESQVRGAACVWCAADLTQEPFQADLGQQPYPGPGPRSYWFPRSCLQCGVAS